MRQIFQLARTGTPRQAIPSDRLQDRSAIASSCNHHGLFLGAVVLGIMLFGVSRVPKWVHTGATFLVAFGTPESLFFILIGTGIVLPTIVGDTLLSYVIFRGKATDLRDDEGQEDHLQRVGWVLADPIGSFGLTPLPPLRNSSLVDWRGSSVG